MEDLIEHNHELLRPNEGLENSKTIGERISINANNIFPFSLKSLTRIAIKKSMCDYSVKNVKKLKGLPEVLKEFILFKEENRVLIESSEKKTLVRGFF